MATSVFRKIIAHKRKPYKVIVLDCDNTLWGGVCGEVGPNGIRLSEPYKNLQLFMLKQMKSGKILCLCSKNVQEDVDRVFSERSDMIIKKKDIVGAKINWQSKSENIKKLSEELNLGLDSFIFVDDNPVECAEVRANCPEVLTLNLPENLEEITSFLDHVWSFDILITTTEDQQRTKLYKDDIKRSTYKNDSSTLKEFIEGLNLEIQIKDAEPEDISRVSQLTFRTNQFNFTTIRRTEEEIKELLETGFKCKICRVKDRFGDYGAACIMIQIEDITRFSSPQRLSSYFGLHPVIKQSGDNSTVSRMSKQGRAPIRKTLYMCANAAVLYDPHMKAIYHRHRAKGKKHRQALGVIMHKLLRVVWGVLTNKTAYDAQIDKTNQQKQTITTEQNLELQRFDENAPISRIAIRNRKAYQLSQVSKTEQVRDLVDTPV